MLDADAAALISSAVEPHTGVWADLGAGRGTFTGALASRLTAGSTVYAIDNDPTAVEALRGIPPGPVRIVAKEGDFTDALAFPEPLDGLLIANALHFVRDAERVLRQLVLLLRPGGRLVLIEYDRRAASRWVPYPIPASRWPIIAERAGLSRPRVTATLPSMYSGAIYVAAAHR